MVVLNLRADGSMSPKYTLDVADFHIGFKQAGGEGVAERVRCDVEVDSGEDAVLVNHAAHGLV